MLDNVFMYNSAQTQSHRFLIIFFSDLFFHLRYFFRKVRSVSLCWNSSHELMERTVWMCSTHSVELPLGLVDQTVTHHLSYSSTSPTSRFYTNMELRDIQTRDCWFVGRKDRQFEHWRFPDCKACVNHWSRPISYWILFYRKFVICYLYL